MLHLSLRKRDYYPVWSVSGRIGRNNTNAYPLQLTLKVTSCKLITPVGRKVGLLPTRAWLYDNIVSRSEHDTIGYVKLGPKKNYRDIFTLKNKSNTNSYKLLFHINRSAGLERERTPVGVDRVLLKSAPRFDCWNKRIGSPCVENRVSVNVTLLTAVFIWINVNQLF